MSFGERLRQLRIERGLNQRTLAETVGIDFTYLSKIETGRLPPPAQDTIHRLALALGASPDELLVLAGKVPDDVRSAITRSVEIPAFLRQIRDLDKAELERLRRYVQRVKGERGSGPAEPDGGNGQGAS